jgi:hypothetical protein
MQSSSQHSYFDRLTLCGYSAFQCRVIEVVTHGLAYTIVAILTAFPCKDARADFSDVIRAAGGNAPATAPQQPANKQSSPASKARQSASSGSSSNGTAADYWYPDFPAAPVSFEVPSKDSKTETAAGYDMPSNCSMHAADWQAFCSDVPKVWRIKNSGTWVDDKGNPIDDLMPTPKWQMCRQLRATIQDNGQSVFAIPGTLETNTQKQVLGQLAGTCESYKRQLRSITK